MINIGIFTTTRAEFGILKPLIRMINIDPDLKLSLFVGGSHLAPEYGKTIGEILDEKITISAKFDYLLNSDSSEYLVKAMGIESFELAKIFSSFSIDFVIVLGDRYELIPIVLASILYKKALVHLHGGEATEGLIDEQIRHMVTKAAHLHFVACDEYRNNLLRMGEKRDRVFNVGALAIDSVLNSVTQPKLELFEKYGLDHKLNTAILTYHPVTLEFRISPLQQIENILSAIIDSNIQFIITAPNIEIDREIIISSIIAKVEDNVNIKYVESLGATNYHSMLNYVDFIVGNSSSGILEAPFFKIPTINIGDRQKGRIHHNSVIDVDYTTESIKKGIQKAIDPAFRDSIKSLQYLFGDGHASERIIEVLKHTTIDQDLMRKRLEFNDDKNSNYC
jgi:GDP/UDP-N,N'-diacetylbacillosamine 2-epimerase (hydrolysing)